MAQQSEDESSFEEDDEDFLNLLHELKREKYLETFFVEYENLTNELKKSCHKEKRLKSICQMLNSKYLSNLVKLTSAVKLDDEDEQLMINKLQQVRYEEIKKALKNKAKHVDKQQRTEKRIADVKDEIAHLLILISQQPTAQHRMGDLQVKSELTAERDELLSKLVTFREDILKVTTNQQKVNAANNEAQETVLQLQQDICHFQKMCTQERQHKDKLENEIKQLQITMESQQGEMDSAKLQSRSTPLQQDEETSTMTLEKLYTNNSKQAMELKMRQQEVNQFKTEVEKLEKIIEVAQIKLCLVEDKKLEVDQQRDMLKNQILCLERETEMVSKKMAHEKKISDELISQRDIFRQNNAKLANTIETQVNWRKLHEHSKETVEKEILSCREEVQKLRKIISELEMETNRHIKEASRLTQKIWFYMRNIKCQELAILKYKEVIADTENKLTQETNLYSVISNDCNDFRKKLIKAQSEIMDMKCKLEIATVQIKQYKDEIKSKETTLNEERQKIMKKEKEKKALQKFLDNKQSKANLKVEKGKLLKAIADADVKKTQKKTELDQVNTECAFLGEQLVIQNNRLAELYGKIKDQQAVLSEAEIQYHHAENHNQLLKLEINKLHITTCELRDAVFEVEQLRRNVKDMQKKLHKQQIKCQDEVRQITLRNPMNVHRWRKLKVNDPNTFELIQHFHSLQRQLLGKTKQMMELDVLLQERKQQFKGLRQTLARCPGPEAEELLQINKEAIRKKRKQLKVLQAKLALYRTRTKEQKQEIQQKEHELQNIKKEYFMKKFREHRSYTVTF